MLDKVSKCQYSDSVFYTNSQDFQWRDLSEWTSSYTENETRIQTIMAKYKKWLSIKIYTRHEDMYEESESSYIDPDMDIVFRYMRTLPKRIRKIVQIKILHPDITITDLARLLKVNRDTAYSDFHVIRRDYPELIYFTCTKFRNEAMQNRV